MHRQQIRLHRTSDHVQIACASVGAGTPIVKAASWLSHLEFDLDSPVWRHLVAELSSRHQLLRYDERGCGLSDWDGAEMSMDAWVRDLETVVDAAGIDRFPLVGMSQGAAIAVEYAARHPDRVSHLILYGGYARGRLKRGLGAACADEAELTIRMAEMGWGNSNPAIRQFFSTQMFPGGSAVQHRWLNELARIAVSPHNASRFLRAFEQIDVEARLTEISCPTLVLHSLRDCQVPFSEATLLAGRIGGARLVPLDSDNHLVLEHEPEWQRWVSELRAFLPANAAPGKVQECGLSKREAAVLELIARGCDNSQVAAHLCVEVKTVRNYITNVFAKLQVENRPQAIIMARNAGLGMTHEAIAC